MIGLTTSETGRAVRDGLAGVTATGPTAFRAQRHRTAWDADGWCGLAEAGWLGARVREVAGGAGLGAEAASGIAETFGAALVPLPYLELALLPSLVLSAAGDEAALAALMAGERRFAVAWQERSDQLIADDALETSVAQDGDSWRLDGRKRFVAGGADATDLLVTARDGERLVLATVPADALGVAIDDGRRIDGGSLADVTFDGVTINAPVAVEPSALDRALDETRIATAVHLLGMMRRVVELTVDYSKTRQQFGQPIGAFQALQHRMVDLAIAVRLGEVACDAALRALDDDAAELALRAAGVKAQIAEAAERVAKAAIQLHGAIGYTDEADIGLFLYRILSLAPWLGTPAALRARHLDLLDTADA